MQIADAIEGGATDMIITSGHARESEWNVGFRYPAGQFRASRDDGSLWAHTDALGPDAVRATDNNALHAGLSSVANHREITAWPKPKVYSAAGNCLMAHVNSERCMALAWMKSAGVVQMMGYTVPTWFGFAGWGTHRYLWGNVGQLTFAEAWFANQQALQMRLAQLEAKKALVSTARDGGGDGDGGGAGALTTAEEFELKGLIFDADATVLYGNPCWEARMVACSDGRPDYYTIDLVALPPDGEAATTGPSGECRTLFEVRVVTLQSGSWTPTCADDKDTLPGRPPFLLHGRQLSAIDVGTGAGLVVTGLFLMVPLEGSFKKGQVTTRRFSADAG